MNKLTFGQICADFVASFVGSWTFIILSSILIASWMLYNAIASRPFDPPPYIGLNLLLSCLAAYQASLVMISANRQAQLDRKRDDDDFVTDQLTHQKVLELHHKVDFLINIQDKE